MNLKINAFVVSLVLTSSATCFGDGAQANSGAGVSARISVEDFNRLYLQLPNSRVEGIGINLPSDQVPSSPCGYQILLQADGALSVALTNNCHSNDCFTDDQERYRDPRNRVQYNHQASIPRGSFLNVLPVSAADPSTALYTFQKRYSDGTTDFRFYVRNNQIQQISLASKICYSPRECDLAQPQTSACDLEPSL